MRSGKDGRNRRIGDLRKDARVSLSLPMRPLPLSGTMSRVIDFHRAGKMVRGCRMSLGIASPEDRANLIVPLKARVPQRHPGSGFQRF